MNRHASHQLRSTLSREQAQPLAAVGAIVCAVIMVVLSGMPVGGQVIVAALIVCGILFRVAVCVHFSLMITLILRGLPGSEVWQTSLGLIDAVFALATVGYVACVFRTLELDVRQIEDQTTREHSPVDTPGATVTDDAESTGGGNLEPISLLRPLAGLVRPALLACGVAIALLVLVGLRNFWPNQFRMLPEALRTIVIIWLLTAAGAGAGLWCATRAWQQLTYQQIGVLVRRTLHEELKRELPHLEIQRSRKLWRLYRNRVEERKRETQG